MLASIFVRDASLSCQGGLREPGPSLELFDQSPDLLLGSDHLRRPVRRRVGAGSCRPRHACRHRRGCLGLGGGDALPACPGTSWPTGGAAAWLPGPGCCSARRAGRPASQASSCSSWADTRSPVSRTATTATAYASWASVLRLTGVELACPRGELGLGDAGRSLPLRAGQNPLQAHRQGTRRERKPKESQTDHAGGQPPEESRRAPGPSLAGHRFYGQSSSSCLSASCERYVMSTTSGY